MNKVAVHLKFEDVIIELVAYEDPNDIPEMGDARVTEVANTIGHAIKDMDIRSAYFIMSQIMQPMASIIYSDALSTMMAQANAAIGETEPQGDSPEGSDEPIKKTIPKHLH